jgi:hypothetical protein
VAFVLVNGTNGMNSAYIMDMARSMNNAHNKNNILFYFIFFIFFLHRRTIFSNEQRLLDLNKATTKVEEKK